MKTFSVLTFLCLFINASAQKQPSVTWGDEFKMSKGSTDLSVISADNSGIYLKETHAVLTSYFIIGATSRTSGTLIKMDKNLTIQYKNDFNKELRGKTFDKFFPLQNKLFIIATDYVKKEKMLQLFAAEVDKNNGELLGDWQEIASWQKDEKQDDISYNLTYTGDSTKMVIVSTIEGKTNNEYQLKIVDSKLKALGRPVTVKNEFDPKTFQLEEFLYTTNGNIVAVGRVYEYQEGKKKKDKFLDFKKYNVRIYNSTGGLVKEINTDIDAKWLVSTKIKQIPNKELLLAAFYSNEKKAKKINGLLVQRIDPITGNIINTSNKDISVGMIDEVENDKDDDPDDESRKERKEREQLEKMQEADQGFSLDYRFRDFTYTPDNGIVVFAERFFKYYYTRSSGGSQMSMSRVNTYCKYQTSDLLMTKINNKGNIDWLHVLPKQQAETILVGTGMAPNAGVGFGLGTSFFSENYNMPFYSSFATISNGNNINLVFNDHSKNATVLQAGQQVKSILKFGSSLCYNLSIDAATGKYTRSVLFNNKDVPTAMPRIGSVLGNTLYMIGREDRMFGKTKIALAKLIVP
jgi:hypothetical protein